MRIRRSGYRERHDARGDADAGCSDRGRAETCWMISSLTVTGDCMDVEAYGVKLAQLIKAARQLIQTLGGIWPRRRTPELAATGSICSACQEEQRQTLRGRSRPGRGIRRDSSLLNQMGVFVNEFSPLRKGVQRLYIHERCRIT